MEFWISVLPGHGHFFPTLPLARALADAGHSVSFCTSATYSKTVRQYGFDCFEIGLDYTLGGGGTVFEGRAPGIDEVEHLMFVEGPVVVAEDLMALFANRKPAAMLVDPVEYGAMTACEAADVPWGGFVTGVRTTLTAGQVPFDPDERDAFVDQRFIEPARRWREAVGLGPSRKAIFEAHYDRTLALMMAPPSLEAWPLGSLSHTGHHLRPEIHVSDAPEAAPEAGMDGPLIVITFGTLFGTRDLYERAVREALRTGADVIAVTSESLTIEDDRLFPVGWASMDRLLARTDVVVHHGGWGSTIAALASGTPAVIVPLGAEQPTNAARVSSTGAGIWVDVDRIETDLYDAVDAILTNPVFRLNAERLQAEIEAMPSAREVVPLVERLATRGVPVLRE